ncbi:GNAT family N-acetyltransferase [Sphingomonas sp. G124]|uniref:GNAT family N-acetyltransferase n=1 Tax=Sphingomonas cremea TaxID=2904799 RepID=A0A9X1TVZ2_9SPHN|nr:GNAT family N-acetyltransferase [Sphingomonas cremea]MCF2513535.1 GNAT family N-acetyltransferase [Sphingomonas cremea]
MATIRKAASLVRLRPGGIDDLDDVMRIMGGAFQPCFGEAWTRSQCAGILPMSGVNLTIAEDNRGPAGFSLARCVADEAELLLIAVDPASQRSGIGQSLLDNFIATVRHWGATKLHLEVRDGNPAVAMYRAAGFIPACRRRNYYHGADGRAYDAVTLILGQ